MLHPLPNTGKDNAPYHHKRSFLSFSAMKTKKDLIEAMVGVGVKKVTGLSIEVVGSADIVSEGGTEYSDSHRDRDLAPASMAGDDDLDGLIARRPRRTPARHCPGCAILIPAESAREYCEMCD